MFHPLWDPAPDQREVTRRAAERYALLAALEERRRARGHRPMFRRILDRVLARRPRTPKGAEGVTCAPETTRVTVHVTDLRTPRGAG